MSDQASGDQALRRPWVGMRGVCPGKALLTTREYIILGDMLSGKQPLTRRRDKGMSQLFKPVAAFEKGDPGRCFTALR